MIYVGIDAASKKRDFTIMNANSEVISKPTTISNDQAGFKKLHTEIASQTELLNEVCIGIEETGTYAKNLLSFLYASGFKVFSLNPLLTSFNQKSISLRKTKTDKIDDLAIYRYIRLNHTILNPCTPTLYNFDEPNHYLEFVSISLKSCHERNVNILDIIDRAIDEIMQAFEFIKSIPGIGNTTGVMILGEIGHIDRFKSASS